jgi:Membrane bound beta barrel domain (DUF5777)
MIFDKFLSYKIQPILALVVLLFSSTVLCAQDEEAVQNLYIKSRGLQRVGNTFESVWLIDNQTVLVPLRKTFEFDIMHRFGTVKNGYDDLLGLYAPSNIRIGFSYVPIKKLMIGFGFTKERLLWDYYTKYALLKEGGQSNSPVSLSYFVNMGLDTRKKDFFRNKTDRLSYFHQLMVARKVSRDFSVQASVSLSHFNNVEGYVNADAEIKGKMKNDHIAFSLLGRYKISDAFAFIANYDQPITKHPTNNPNPNISVGVELATPLHAFQVFVGNYKWIVPQYNNVLNQNDFTDGAFLIGFNITRLLDVQEEDMGEMMFKRK